MNPLSAAELRAARIPSEPRPIEPHPFARTAPAIRYPADRIEPSGTLSTLFRNDRPTCLHTTIMRAGAHFPHMMFTHLLQSHYSESTAADGRPDPAIA
ncbi:hypothetical protein [Burkholderia pseudomultivorans]|uniref:hypothetical protein n=1 Tax=Burkholderia pseudomultivorans TaxID=1207504 RepID=UPI000AEBEB97|nr:hypothetical protein [Burkholderia pseudomultivorans]